MSFVVRKRDDLQHLPSPEGIMHPFRKPQLLIRIPQIAEPEARVWEWRLENLRQQCGCAEGAIALGVFALSFVAVAIYNTSPATGNLQRGEFLLDGVLFLGGLIVSALVGKFIGLSVAMVRYRFACFELQERLRQLDETLGSSNAAQTRLVQGVIRSTY